MSELPGLSEDDLKNLVPLEIQFLKVVASEELDEPSDTPLSELRRAITAPLRHGEDENAQ